MLRRRLVLLAAAVTALSCATINSETTVRETRIREWSETERGAPSIRFDTASADDKMITGRVEEFRTCRDLSKEEVGRIALIHNKPKRLWLPILGAVATGSLGAYLLATAHTRSDKPGKNDDGEETMSPQTASYVFGGISAGGAVGFLGYTTGLAVRSIDREKPMDNVTRVADESAEYDCEVVGRVGAAVNVSSPRLGLDRPVEVTRTDESGELRFALTDVPEFKYPVDDSETVMLTLSVADTEAEVPVDDWVFAPLDDAKTGCREFDSCVKTYSALKQENDNRKTNIRDHVKSLLVAFAQNNEESCRKFEKTFAVSNDFGNMDDIRDVCDFFAVQKKGNLSAIQTFLKKKRSGRTTSAAEQFAYNLISANPAIEDCRWFESRFPQSQYLPTVRDYLLSLEFSGVPVSLLKCCAMGDLKIVDILRNEKKGWSEALAVEQVMQSTSHFRRFNADEIEHLRRAGMRDAVIQAVIRKAGQAEKKLEANAKEAEYARREAVRSEGDIKRCIVGCEKDFGECADRRGTGFLDMMIFDTTNCKPAYNRCVAACKE